MNTDTKIIDNIMSVPFVQRSRLQKDVIRFATKQCNGDYYWSDDDSEWKGEEAHKADPLEKSIVKRLWLYGNGIANLLHPYEPVTDEELPDFITYNNDPRGFVLKIEAERLSDEAKQYCRDTNLLQDWGGDYTILTNKEAK